jgi:hypothetical protein
MTTATGHSFDEQRVISAYLRETSGIPVNRLGTRAPINREFIGRERRRPGGAAEKATAEEKVVIEICKTNPIFVRWLLQHSGAQHSAAQRSGGSAPGGSASNGHEDVEAGPNSSAHVEPNTRSSDRPSFPPNQVT